MATRVRIVVVAALAAAGLGFGTAPEAQADSSGGMVCSVTYEATRWASGVNIAGSGTCVGADGMTYTATMSSWLGQAARIGCPGSIPFKLHIGTVGGGTLRFLVWDPSFVPSAQSSIPPGALLGLKPATPQAFAGSLVPNGLRMISAALHECGDWLGYPNSYEKHTAGVAVIELGALTLPELPPLPL